MENGFKSASGGDVNIGIVNHKFSGYMVLLHIDQTSNISNGEGDASIVLNAPECKEMIKILDRMITVIEGKPFCALIDHNNQTTEDNVPPIE